ncbi:MAG TPA: isopentenyl-diphosphate delta-isomerase [Coxiellaceae bacterium]|nr:isopentenyl-diphosphate delta-isomerase [Coxiellaceae bacterium]
MVYEEVILVDDQDKAIGVAEKQAAHEKALLHRAFSVFIFYRTDTSIELLLQQRAKNKYHAGGLWTNTCCGHPRPQETILAAAERRLREEMGLSISLREIGTFQYTAHFDNGLTENEIDHVCIGFATSKEVTINPIEAENYRWIDLQTLAQELEQSSHSFTPWFPLALQVVLQHVHG